MTLILNVCVLNFLTDIMYLCVTVMTVKQLYAIFTAYMLYSFEDRSQTSVGKIIDFTFIQSNHIDS